MEENELTVDLLDDVILGERWEEGESLEEPAKRRRSVVREGCRISSQMEWIRPNVP